MTKQRSTGFQKRIKPSEFKEVGLAVVHYTESGAASCSCGWRHNMARTKVLEDAIDRHLTKRHGGRGIRL
jgi:hypothetical protein